ncbi:hypothetical protein ACFQU7_19680 [Pseudoroseomonas wenyumeiae]
MLMRAMAVLTEAEKAGAVPLQPAEREHMQAIFDTCFRLLRGRVRLQGRIWRCSPAPSPAPATPPPSPWCCWRCSRRTRRRWPPARRRSSRPEPAESPAPA